MNYNQLIKYLHNKYGEVPYPYFCKKNCKSIQPKNKKTDEGLFIHHIREDEYIDLSHTKFAISQPWEYQLPPNLVYANLIEHSMLHCLIQEENGYKNGNFLGTGYFNLTMPFVEDIRDDYSFKMNYRRVIAKQVKPYFFILKEIFKRAGFPILTKVEKEQEYKKYLEDLHSSYKPKSLLELKKDIANEYILINDKSVNNLSRTKIINYISDLTEEANDDVKKKYINKNRELLIVLLDNLTEKVVKLKSNIEYKDLIYNFKNM